jgi:hypothetical protein
MHNKMIKKYSFLLIIIFANFFLLKAQNNLDKLVTINAINKPLIEVLTEIERKTGVVFSYNSEIINKNELININIQNKPLKETLNSIFVNQPILFKDLGNQIVLYLDKSKVIETLSLSNENKQNIVKTENPQIREIIINDTIYRYINTTSIKVYDTVRYVFYDTIRPKEIKKPTFSIDFGFSYLLNNPIIYPVSEQYLREAKIIKNAEKFRYSYNIFALFNKSFGKNSILSTGFIYSKITEKYNYNINETYTRTVYKKELIKHLDSVNFTIRTGGGKPGSGADTTWYYYYSFIQGDRYLQYSKTDTLKLIADGINKYNFISIPIEYGFEKRINNKFSITTLTGTSIDILLAKNGTMLDARELQLVKLKEIPFIRFNISWMIDEKLNYYITPTSSLLFDISYKIGLQSQYSIDVPVRKMQQILGFSMGYRILF